MTDLTGIWETLITDFSTLDKYVGELHVTQTGNLVLSHSAPGWDTWLGSVAAEPTGVEMLTAFCHKDGLPRIIQARVSQDGDTLYGQWSMALASQPPRQTGAYLAKRRISGGKGSHS